MKSFFVTVIALLLLASSGVALILFGCLWLNKGFDAASAEFERLVRSALGD